MIRFFLFIFLINNLNASLLKGVVPDQKSKIWNTSKSTKVKTSSALDKFNKEFADLAERLSPSVVFIESKFTIKPAYSFRSQGGSGNIEEELFRFFFGSPGMRNPNLPQKKKFAQSFGSGFVINKNGLIITNNHVVTNEGRKADEIKIRFLGESEKSPGHLAQVIGTDPDTDVAVLKLIKPKESLLKPVMIGSSDSLRVGEWVIAIGNPYGHSFTVTKGIVSALGRDVAGLNNRSAFIQTDASINVGNSGGPLFNLKGEVIGINTAIDARAQGIGFAVPIDTAKFVIKQLVEKGNVTRGFIGIGGMDLNPKIAKALGVSPSQEGIVVQQIVEGGPAKKAGLKVYDILLKVGSKKLKSFSDLRRIVARLPVGKSVSIEYLRDGKTKTTNLKIASNNDSVKPKQSQQKNPQPKILSKNDFGLSLKKLTKEDKIKMNLSLKTSGVLIEEVVPGGVSQRNGLEAGDIILEINKKPMTDPKSVLSTFSSGARFLVRILRGSDSFILILDKNN